MRLTVKSAAAVAALAVGMPSLASAQQQQAQGSSEAQTALTAMAGNAANWVMPNGNYANTRYSDAGPDQQGQRQGPPGRLDLLDRRAARPRGRPAGHRRHDVRARAVPEHRLRARPQRPRQRALEVRAEAGPERHPGDVLRHGQPRRGLRRRQDLPAPGRHHAGGARRQDRQGGVERQDRRPVEGRHRHRPRRWSYKDKVYVGVSGGEFGVRGWLAAYNTQGRQAGLARLLDGPRRRHADRPARRRPRSASRSARTAARPPGKATSGRSAAAPPGAGTPSIPS